MKPEIGDRKPESKTGVLACPPKFKLKIGGETAFFVSEPPPSWKRKLLKRVLKWEVKLTKPGERASSDLSGFRNPVSAIEGRT
jgi:hypothetical protein